MAEQRDIKSALGHALVETLRATPLSKVTVAGLATRVGISRQAFYYHFIDVYDLAAWVFETEIANHILAHANYEQWATGFQQLLTYLKTNKNEAYAVIRSLDPHALERFMFAQFQVMMRAIVCDLRGGIDVSDSSCSLVVDHFASVVLGYMVRWLAEDMRADPMVLVAQLEYLLRGQVLVSLQSLSETRKPNWNA